jgi:hypothetical protein
VSDAEPATRNTVAADECQQMRALAAEGDSAESISETLSPTRHPSTVRRHVHGHCQHGDEGAKQSPHHRLTVVQCRMLQDRYRGGNSLYHIEQTTVYGCGTVRQHARGECSHTHEWNRLGDTSPYDGPELPQNHSLLGQALMHPDVSTFEEAREKAAELREGSA